MSLDISALLADSLDLIAAGGVEGWEPYPWQVPPAQIATQGAWLIEGGRGIGKTDGCAHYVLQHVEGPPCDPRIPGGHRLAIVAPTLDDAAESCVSGPSGLRAYDPSVVVRTALGGSKAVWPSGAEAKLFSGASEKDADRLRAGGNRCLVWVEECAAIPWLGTALKQARYGLRVGNHPHIVASSTPRPTADYRAFRSDRATVRTHGTTEQAVHLDAAVRQRLYEDYAGSRLGRQELGGELLEDVEGALWRLDTIDRHRVTDHPDLDRIVVAVDPAATAGGDETGIVAAGVAAGEVYVLADESLRSTPAGWASKAIGLLDRVEGDLLVGEVNNGGEMVEHTLRSVRRDVPFRRVVASRGKRVRAEPIAALYERGHVHHVGAFPALEDQLTSWTPDAGQSPDRLDALVWAVATLTEGRRGPRVSYRGAA